MNLRSARKIFLRSPATYRPMVRWLWNDHVDPDWLSAQMDQMLDMGMGGALIRPGAGLPPGAYLSDDWFEAVAAVARRARRRRASLWIAEDFDDSFTRSIITGILRNVPEHAAHMLAMDDLALGIAPLESVAPANCVAAFEVTRETARSGSRVPIELRPIDSISDVTATSRRLQFRTVTLTDRLRLFEPAATLELLSRTHQQYHMRVKKYFGNTIGLGLILGAGAPFAPGMIPWDPELLSLFHENYGYALVPNLPALFFDLPGCEAVRGDYWGLVDEMLREGFDEPFARWSAERGIPHAATLPDAGALDHMVARGGPSMLRHAAHTFAALRLESRETGAPENRVAHIEARSVKRQLGIEGVVEIAAAGSPVMSHLLHGVNFLAARTALSSLRGARKESVPPLLIPREDDAHTRATTDAEARLAWMLGQGKAVADVLLIHPYTSLQVSYRAQTTGAETSSPVHGAIAGHFNAIILALEEAKIEFDLGDEALLAKHGTAHHRTLRAGTAEYRVVVLPPMLNLRSSTLELLHDFAIGGGLVIAAGSLAELVDGRGSDRVLRFFEEYGERVVQGIDFGRYRALVTRLQRIITDPRAKAASLPNTPDRVLIQRRVWDEIEMVALHNTNDASAHFALSHPAIVTGRTESWDPFTGDAQVLSRASAGELPAQPVLLGPDGTTLIVTTPDEPDDAIPGLPEIEESRVTPAWSVRCVEPNIAVLRECRIEEAGASTEWTIPEIIRPLLAERLTQTRGPVSLRTHWRFRVEQGSAVIANCTIASEKSEGASMALDGIEIEAESNDWRFDPSFRLAGLPPLSPGEHVFEIWRLYSAPGEFQPPWVQGPFTNTASVGEETRITAMRGALTLDELTTQRLPAYCGEIVYAARVDGFTPGDARRIQLRLTGLQYPAEIRIDGSRAGFVLPPQKSCDVTDTWRPGSRLVEVSVRIPPDGLLAALCSWQSKGDASRGILATPEIAVLARRANRAPSS